MTTVIYHSADMDGLFCREIARKFLGDKDAQYIGWNFGDPPIEIPSEGKIYVMDLPLDKPFGVSDRESWKLIYGAADRITWIDHHKSAIDSHPKDIPGYRIDGVAASRLAWQYFTHSASLPTKQDFLNRKVSEPLAVRLAGEWDVWDKRDPRAETFQYGLRSLPLEKGLWFKHLLAESELSHDTVKDVLDEGKPCQRYAQKQDANLVEHNSWLMDWEGLKFLCLNCGPFNSNTFAAKDVPGTGHDALLGFRFTGKSWLVSLYHAKHRTDLDLSKIAVKYGGGGPLAQIMEECGFTCKTLPFQL